MKAELFELLQALNKTTCLFACGSEMRYPRNGVRLPRRRPSWPSPISWRSSWPRLVEVSRLKPQRTLWCRTTTPGYKPSCANKACLSLFASHRTSKMLEDLVLWRGQWQSSGEQGVHYHVGAMGGTRGGFLTYMKKGGGEEIGDDDCHVLMDAAGTC